MSISPTDGAITAGRRELVRGLLVSVAVAAAILVAAVLPAEYGIDPLRIGRVTGLSALRAGSPPEAAAAASVPAGGPAARQVPPYRSDSREVTLAPGKGVEVKARLDKGAAILFSWKTRDGAKVVHDFHGDAHDAAKTEQSFIKDDAASESRGYLVAPFNGSHGWYWKNRTAAPVTIDLQVSGFYTAISGP